MAKGSLCNSEETVTECRICIDNEGVRPIWGNNRSPDISLEMTIFGGIQVYENDNFPQSICDECFKLLENAIIFRQLAKKSDSILRRRINKLKKKGYTGKASEILAVKKETKVTALCEPKIEFVSIIGNEDKEEIKDCEISENKHDINNETYIEDISKQNQAIIGDEHIEKFEESMEIEKLEDDFDDILNENIEENDDEAVMLIISQNQTDIKKQKIKGRCKICNLSFQTLDDFEQHQKSFEHKKRYVMSFLPKKQRKKDKTSNDVDFKSTETVHPKDHKCEICNRYFTKLHFPRHMQTQHQVSMITSRSNIKKECPVCKGMYHPVALNRHMKKVHVDEKDQPPKQKTECPICKKQISKEFFPLHLQRHNTITEKYICDQCGQKFYYQSTFLTHRLIHSNKLPHKCMHCPYRGRTKSLLKIHVRTHTGDKPYECTQCDTRCLTKSNLNAHIKRHRGPVDFTCDTCNRGFYTRNDLDKHISVIHLGIKNHVCDICGMHFGYRHGLSSHQVNVHKRNKGVGKPKAVYLKLEEDQPEVENDNIFFTKHN